MAGQQKQVVDRESYPSNSMKGREKIGPDDGGKPIVKPIVTGRVRKKSFLKRVSQTIFGDDTRSVGGYVMQDILIPAFKDLVVDSIRGGIEVAVYGERSTARNSRSRNGHTNYDRVSYRSDRGRDDRREIPRSSRSRHDFNDITFDTRVEADDVRMYLVDMCVDYGQATVADLYDLTNVVSDFTDRKWGWTNLNSASISRVREGFIINFPRTEQLD